eukprot:2509406-Prymnesium_polylepis.1
MAMRDGAENPRAAGAFFPLSWWSLCATRITRTAITRDEKQNNSRISGRRTPATTSRHPNPDRDSISGTQ